MLARRIFSVTAVAFLTACGGGGASKGGAASPVAAAQQKDAEAFAQRTGDVDGKPGWTTKGSGAVKVGKERVFYGVGIVAGVRNPALARTTAGSRARAEIGKLVETYSASLMKDYMSSDVGTGRPANEQQQIEQAIKTASSVSLRGTEIVDHYYEANGTIFALAQLDIAKMNDALAAASKSGAFKSYVTKVDTDDIFDQHGRKAEPPPPPPKVASDDSNAAPPPPPEAKKDDVPKAKSKPAWVDGDDPRFPREEYMCGVGFGPTRSHAENGAFAAISRVFVANVASVAKDFMGAYQSTGAPDLEVQWTEQLTQVVTNKTLTGVEFRELWEDRKSGTYYGLACLDRARAAADLMEQIQTQDAQTESALQRSRRTDKQTRFAMLAQALESVAKREALNAELRIVKFDGVGVPGPYSHGDVAAAFSEAQDSLLVGMQAEGPYADEFAGIFEERLTSRGYKVSVVDDGDFTGQDVVVKASIKFKETGILDPNDPFYYAEGVVIINVINNATGKKLKTLTKRRKEGRRTQADAERLVVIKFAKAHAKDVGIAIDNAMKGK